MLPLIRQVSINVRQIHFIIHFQASFKTKHEDFRQEKAMLIEDGDRMSMLSFFLL